MSEKEHLILTAIGPDRVGLVETLAALISRQGCNIEDSRMAAFCGEFAVILLLSGSAGNLSEIAGSTSEIESETGLTITAKKPSLRKPGQAFIMYKLTAACMDHPGIVHKITNVLTDLEVNIEAMETRTYSAPMSGTPLFQLEAELSVPVRTNITQLRERLAVVQREQNIDIEITVLTR
jgi:glycine cleavage system transcriptional repressor